MVELKPFKDLKVVDLSSILAGPEVGSFFAELGAEVIKFENPRTGGDATRSWKSAEENPDAAISAYYASVNFGKQVRQADLTTSDGINEIYRSLKIADILLMNFKEGDEYKFGLDYGRVSAIKNDIICAQLRGFEAQAGRPAFDVVLQAETGYMSMNGTLDSGPVKMPVALIDVLAAHQLKEAILISLWQRERTGKGALIKCSLEAAAISSLMNQATNYLMTGRVAGRIGTLHPNIAPYGELLNCVGGRQVVLAAGNDRQFAALCKVLGAAELVNDIRFASNPDRVRNRAALIVVLNSLSKEVIAEDLLKELTNAKVPAGIVRSLDEVLSGPVARKMMRTEMMEGTEARRISSVAFSIV